MPKTMPMAAFLIPGARNPMAVALLASLGPGERAERTWRIHQGVDMGRPSLLLGRTTIRDGIAVATHIGGRCVAVLAGSFV
jgi:trans-2,3-dihydro-3-hydroxyanthranilate isomerase